MSLPSFAHPGQTLGSTTSYTPGPGTHIHNSLLVASLAGKPIKTDSSSASQPKPIISITLPRTSSETASKSIPSRQVSRRNVLPSVNAIVLARVTRLQQRQANVAILVVDGVTCADEFSGVIRREDVRGWEVDKIKVAESFRVGDVVRAVVISLGDQSSYYLSTARNELGVLLAHSEAGNQMVPVSWQYFRDTVTGVDEVRKVAKPI